MPKISAPTVKEHHQAVLDKLVDAAEAILREHASGDLRAGAVSSRAGIARNSIYRYVDSISDLRGLVLARYLPRWLAAVDDRVRPVTDPRERIVVWVTANLEQASVNGHGWLMEVARAARLDRGVRSDLDQAHATADFIVSSLREIGVEQTAVRAELIRSIADAGFRSLDAGESLDDVTRCAVVAVRSLLD